MKVVLYLCDRICIAIQQYELSALPGEYVVQVYTFVELVAKTPELSK